MKPLLPMSIAAETSSSSEFRGGSKLSASYARPTQDWGPMRERAQSVGGDLVSSIGIVQEHDAPVETQREDLGRATDCAAHSLCDGEQTQAPLERLRQPDTLLDVRA